MAWTVTTVATIASTTDQQTYDSTDTNITFTAGKTYLVSVFVCDTAAEAAGDPTSVGASDASAAFTKIGNGFAYATNRNISWWYYKPGSTLTGKTLRVVCDDAVTGLHAHLLSIDESTADPPHVAANVKTDAETDTDVTVTPDALGSASNLQLAAGGTNEQAAQTLGGTGWAAILSATTSFNTPATRFTTVKNDSGTAAAVTFSSASSLDRGLVSIEIAAAVAAGSAVAKILANH